MTFFKDSGDRKEESEFGFRAGGGAGSGVRVRVRVRVQVQGPGGGGVSGSSSSLGSGAGGFGRSPGGVRVRAWGFAGGAFGFGFGLVFSGAGGFRFSSGFGLGVGQGPLWRAYNCNEAIPDSNSKRFLRPKAQKAETYMSCSFGGHEFQNLFFRVSAMGMLLVNHAFGDKLAQSFWKLPGLPKIFSVATPAEPRGEKKTFFWSNILGGEKLLKFVEKCR